MAWACWVYLPTTNVVPRLEVFQHEMKKETRKRSSGCDITRWMEWAVDTRIPIYFQKTTHMCAHGDHCLLLRSVKSVYRGVQYFQWSSIILLDSTLHLWALKDFVAWGKTRPGVPTKTIIIFLPKDKRDGLLTYEKVMETAVALSNPPPRAWIWASRVAVARPARIACTSA